MKKQSKKANPYPTVLTIVTGFLVIYFLTGWKWILIAAFLLGLGALFSRRLAGIIQWIWMEFARILGLIIPKILLTIVYYLILFPTALLSKLFRKEPPVNLDKNKNSMFREMNKSFGKEDFLKPW